MNFSFTLSFSTYLELFFPDKSQWRKLFALLTKCSQYSGKWVENVEKALFQGNLDTFIWFAIGNTGLLLWRVGGGCSTVAGFEVFYAVQVIQWASCLRCHYPMTRRLNFARPSLDASTPVLLNFYAADWGIYIRTCAPTIQRQLSQDYYT